VKLADQPSATKEMYNAIVEQSTLFDVTVCHDSNGQLVYIVIYPSEPERNCDA